MLNQSQLPYLIQLIEDDSPSVREAVVQELKNFGPDLEEHIARLQYPLSPYQRNILQKIFHHYNCIWLHQAWRSWFHLDSDTDKLELAFQLLADFQLGKNYPVKLSCLLDQLACEYSMMYKERDAFLLAKFLFSTPGRQLRGNRENYYDPLNSNLVFVLEQSMGIPISLVVVYILVAARLGMPVSGCNFPGHFLAQVAKEDELYVIDCFNYAQIINIKSISEMMPVCIEDDIRRLQADAETIMARVLRNLMFCYKHLEDEEKSEFMVDLLQQLEDHRKWLAMQKIHQQDPTQDVEAYFYIGQIVHHKKYGYRGVIVDYDLSCKASEEWYNSNHTQPHRHQPWYHILVHTSSQNTYVAQSNLIEDTSKEPISHPYLAQFFSEFKDGYYIRNSQPWPHV